MCTRKLSLALSFAFLFSGAALAPSQAHAQAYENLEPLNSNILIESSGSKPYSDNPVSHFGEVEKGFYRGGAPKNLDDMKAIKKLGIKTVINLQYSKSKIASENAWAKSLGMQSISIPLPGFGAPSDADVAKIQALLKNESLRPLLLHCAHGEERTGLQTALYRVNVNGWSPQRAYSEWKAYGFHTWVYPMKNYFEDASHTDL